jgi:citrate lyase subunit beta/citryl-CoA lyase
MEPDSPGWDVIRVSVVVASAAAGLAAPIAGVDPAFDDPERIEADTRRLAHMGFGGRAAIHPAQVEPINRAFVPSTAQVRNALDILSRHEAAAAQGAGTYRDGQGRMVDEAVVRQARRTIDLARVAGVEV